VSSSVRRADNARAERTVSSFTRRALAPFLCIVVLAIPVAAGAGAGAPVNTSLPTVSGLARVGSTLVATPGSWASPASYTTALQWQRCSSPTTCLPIALATGSTYLVSALDAGMTLRVAVVATNKWASSTAFSLATAIVTSPPVSTSLPVVSGVAQVGSTLSTTTGSWTGTAPISYAYQWRRCDTAGGACVAIVGATLASYALTSADLGKTVRSAVTASNAVGSATATSNATAIVVSPPTSGPIPGTGIHRLGSTYATASGYNRYSYVVVGRGDATKAAALPGTSLVYHSGMAVSSAFDTGVPYSQAVANNWLLKTSGGAFITAWGYPTSYLADVGSTAFQQAWITNVSAYLTSTGADGTYIDDVVGDVAAWSSGAVYPAKYPSQSSWENAMAAFVTAVGPALKARGFYVLVNAHKFVSGNVLSNDGTLEVGWWERLGPSVSGLHTEYWMQSATNISQLRAIGPEWWNSWDGWQRLVAVAQGTGADFFGYMKGSVTNTRAMRYGKASFLLDWDGQGGGFIYFPTDGPDPWNSAWTADIGRPTAAKTSLATGVWQRRYERGTVVVNATLATVTVTVDGVARTIGPTDALILTS